MLLKAIVEDSARDPINGYITKPKVTIAMKFSIVCFLGLSTGSIKPEWSPEDNLAPKMLTNPPLSPENNGTKVNNVWFLSNVLIELFNIPPATVPKMEQKNKTGVDCLTICLTSFSAVYPEINDTSVTMIAKANNTILTTGWKPMKFTIKTLKMIAGKVKKSPIAAMNGVVILSGSQPPSKLLREMNMVIGNMIIVETNPAKNEIRTKS